MDFLRDIIDRFFTRRMTPLAVMVVLLASGLIIWFGANALLSSDGGDPQPPLAQTLAAPDPPVAEAPPPAEEADPDQPVMLVARRPIPGNVGLSEALVAWRRPTAPLPEGLTAIREDTTPLAEIRGALVVRPHQAGEPIAWENVILPGELGFLAAILSEQKRAVTLEVDRATNSANIILPGDRVDLIMVSNVDHQDGPSSQIIAANARVLAVGSTILAPDIRSSIISSFIEGTGPTFDERSEASSYTLEVSPDEAQAIALVTAVSGHLTFALRGRLADGGVAKPASLSALVPPFPTVQIIRGRERADEPVAAAGAGA